MSYSTLRVFFLVGLACGIAGKAEGQEFLYTGVGCKSWGLHRQYLATWTGHNTLEAVENANSTTKDGCRVATYFYTKATTVGPRLTARGMRDLVSLKVYAIRSSSGRFEKVRPPENWYVTMPSARVRSFGQSP